MLPRDRARTTWADAAALAGLALLWLQPVWLVWRRNLVLSSMDTFCQHLPDYLTSAALWRWNRPPLWNPFLQCGMPQLAYVESAAFYPGIALFRWLSAPAAFNVLIAAHWLSLGVGMYVWARALGLKPLSAFASSALVMRCHLTAEHLPYSGFFAFGWMPWLGYLLTRLAERRLWRDAALAAAAIALPFYGGHPQYWVSWLALCAAFSVYLVRRAPAGARSATAWPLATAWTAGLLLTMPQALPTLAFLREGPRSAFHDSNAAFTLGEHHSLLSFSSSLLLEFRDPGNFVYGPEGHVFLGLLTLLLAGAGAAAPAPAGFFALAALAGAAVALSAYTGAHLVGWRIPILGLMHSAKREALLFVYPTALLAGFGLEAVAARREEERTPRRWAPALVVVTLAATALASQRLAFLIDDSCEDRLIQTAALSRYHPLVRAWFILGPDQWQAVACLAALLAGALVILLCARRWLSRRGARAALAAGMLTALWPQLARPLGWVPTSESRFLLRAEPPPAARIIAARERERLAPGRLISFSQQPLLSVSDRVFFLPRESRSKYWEYIALEMLLPNASQLFGVYQAGLWHDAFTRTSQLDAGLENWQGHAVNPDLLSPASPLLPMLGVRYVLLHRLDAADPKIARSLRSRSYALLQSWPHVQLWERRDVYPRAWLVGSVEPAPPRRELLDALIGTKALVPDLRRRAFADAPAGAMAGLGAELAASTATLAAYEPDRLRVSVDARGGDAWLVIGDAYDPGWRAWIDGAPAAVYRTDLLVRGLRVPAGRHEVTLRYRPRPLLLGLLAAAAGAALLALAALFAPRLARKA